MSTETAVAITIAFLVMAGGLAIAVAVIMHAGPTARLARKKQPLAAPAAQAAASALGGQYIPMIGSAAWNVALDGEASRTRFIEEVAALGIGIPLTADPFTRAITPSLLNVVRAERSYGMVTAYQFYARIPGSWKTYHNKVSIEKENLNSMLFVIDFLPSPELGFDVRPAVEHMAGEMRRLAKHAWNEPLVVEANGHVMIVVTHPNSEAMVEYYEALAVLPPGVAV